MEFRLTYEGPLKAASRTDTRAAEKHAVRKTFHKQLANLWGVHPALVAIKTNPPFDKEPGRPARPEIEIIAEKFSRCGYQFVPIVTTDLCLCCELDILFLRRQDPGALIGTGGDIDNRLKTLLDALRLPTNCDEVKGPQPEKDETPFFCLLQDDALVTGLKITTDRLLKPMQVGQADNDVHLIISVLVKPTRNTWGNTMF